MGPYTKHQNSTAIDDGWTIEDGEGGVIAHLDTETMADAMLDALAGRQPEMPELVRASLRAIICYCWADERGDAEGRLREDGDIGGHAFDHLVNLDNWLGGVDKKPEDYLAGDDED